MCRFTRKVMQRCRFFPYTRFLSLIVLGAWGNATVAQSGIQEPPCRGLACHGLTFLAPLPSPLDVTADLALVADPAGQATAPPLAISGAVRTLGLVSFDLQARDPLSQAFANQVIDLVRANLAGVAQVAPPVAALDPLALLAPAQRVNLRLELNQAARSLSVSQSEKADNMADNPTAAGVDEAAPAPPTQRERSQWLVSGTVEQRGEEVVELAIAMQPVDLSDRAAQPLVVRAAAGNWRQVAHYISDVLFEEIYGQRGTFDSQILFVAESAYQGRFLRRLALIDQAGGGLAWVREAGHQVGFATFLGNRFEIAMLNMAQEPPQLIHLNLLTRRRTPLAQLPNLVGRPTIAAGGRLIAFAHATGRAGPGALETDITVVDVRTRTVQQISLPRFQERDPHIAPSHDALAFVSLLRRDDQDPDDQDPDDQDPDDQDHTAVPLEARARLMLARLPAPMTRVNRRSADSPTIDSPPMPRGLAGRDVAVLYRSAKPLAQPAWAPSGRAIAFIERGEDQDDLLVYDLAAGAVHRIASGPSLAQPAWSPDSRSLVLIATTALDGPGTLIRLDLGRGQSQILPTPFTADAPAWSPRSLSR